MPLKKQAKVVRQCEIVFTKKTEFSKMGNFELN